MQSSGSPAQGTLTTSSQTHQATEGPCKNHLLSGETIIDDLDKIIFLTTHRVLVLGHSETLLGKIARLLAGEVNGDIVINEIVGLKFGRTRPWPIFIIGAVLLLVSVVMLLTGGDFGIMTGLGVGFWSIICLVIWYIGKKVFVIEGGGTVFTISDLDKDPTEFAKKVRAQYYAHFQYQR